MDVVLLKDELLLGGISLSPISPKLIIGTPRGETAESSVARVRGERNESDVRVVGEKARILCETDTGADDEKPEESMDAVEIVGDGRLGMVSVGGMNVVDRDPVSEEDSDRMEGTDLMEGVGDVDR